MWTLHWNRNWVKILWKVHRNNDCSAPGSDPVQCSRIRSTAVLQHTIQCSAPSSDLVQCSRIRSSAVFPDPIQCSVPGSDPVQCSRIRSSAVFPDPIQDSLAWEAESTNIIFQELTAWIQARIETHKDLLLVRSGSSFGLAAWNLL